MIKKICGYLIVLFHIIPLIIVLLLIILILFKFKINLFISYFFVVYSTLIIIGWAVFGNCILTHLENYLLPNEKKYNDNTTRSHISILIEKYLNINEIYIYYFFVYFQILTIVFFLLHIFITKKLKIIKNN